MSRPGGGYLPRHYELLNPKPGEKFHIDIAPGFDRFPDRNMPVANALASSGGWRLTLTSDPRDALPHLEEMLKQA